MTSAELARAEAAYRLLMCGKTEEAREKLAVLITDAGGSLPVRRHVSVVDGGQGGTEPRPAA